MSKSFQNTFLGLALICSLLISETNAIPSGTFLRVRREAEAEPKPEASSSTMSSMMAGSSSPISVTVSSSTMASGSSSSSSASPSPHDSHNVKCDADTSSLKNKCPNDMTCPTDEMTMEKCCHCLSFCCNSQMMGGMGDGPTPEPEGGSNAGNVSSGNKKGFGDKMKDVAHSAEGWMKNAGENIKNSWDKAKDSIKHTARDVQDKVKKGIDSMTNKGKNSTDNGTTECREKDGKCSTDMTNNSDSSSAERSSEESSSPSSMMSMSTTNTPGYRKMKRDTYGYGNTGMRYPSSSLYGTGNRYTSGFRDTDNSDSGSNEFAYSRTITRQTGSRDFNRRYKRSSPQQRQPDMHSSRNNNSSIPESPSTDSTRSRTKRGTRNSMYGASMDGPNTSAENRSSSTLTRSSSSSSSNSMRSSDGNNGYQQRYKRDYDVGSRANSTATAEVSTTSMSNSQQNGNSGGRSRSRREARDEHSSSTSNDNNSTESVGTSAGPPSEHSYHSSGGRPNNNRRGSSSQSIRFPPESAPLPGRGSYMPSMSQSSPPRHSYEQYDGGDQMDHPPMIMYPDGSGGGVISASSSSKYNNPSYNNPSYNNPNYNNPNYNSPNYNNPNHNNCNSCNWGGNGNRGNSTFKSSSYSSSGSSSNGMMFGSGSGRHMRSINVPYFQEYSNPNPNEEYSPYYPILSEDMGTIPTEMTNSPSNWPYGGGWGSSSPGSEGLLGGNGNYNQGNNRYQHHHHHQHNHNYNYPHQNHGSDYGNQQFQNQEEPSWGAGGGGGGGGGGVLDSGDFNFDISHGHGHNQGHHFHDHHNHNDGSYNNSSGHNNYPHHQNSHHHHHHNQNHHHHQGQDDDDDEGNWTHGVISTGDVEKDMPGACRPLAGYEKCSRLRADSAECLYDSDCSGSKKCCFYNCDPYKIVGLCEYVTYTVTKPGSS